MNGSTGWFYRVTTDNRLAVRKLVTRAHGDGSSLLVARLKGGELGQALHDAVKAGKVQHAEAYAAVGHSNCWPLSEKDKHDEDISVQPVETSTPAPIPAPTPAPNGNGHAAHAVAAALQAALGNLMTEERVFEIANDIANRNHQVIKQKVDTDVTLLSNLFAEVRSALNGHKERIEELQTRTSVSVTKLAQDLDKLKKERSTGIQVIEIKTEDKSVKLKEGAHKMLPEVLQIISTRIAGRRQHVWLVGESGTGKSFLARQAARSLSLKYYSTGAIAMKHELVGYRSPNGDDKTLRTPFREAFEHGGVFAWDEIDASNANALTAFNEALANGVFAFPDGMVEAHTDFVCIASANTWGTGATARYVGRTPIDAATIDRFVRVEIDYDEDLERAMVGDHEFARWVHKLRKAVRTDGGLQVLVTSRMILKGVGLLGAGIPRDRVEHLVFWGAVTPDQRQRILRHL